jgi:ribosome-binding factor A
LTTRRLLKAAEAIREVVASAIVTELRDPRVQGVTVIGVKVSPDMREAKVAVSIMGDEKQEKLTLRGLQNSAGFLQQKIAQRIDTRHTPKLEFTVDRGVQNSLVVGEILAQIKREKEAEMAAKSDSIPVQSTEDQVQLSEDQFQPTEEIDHQSSPDQDSLPS